MRCGWDDGYFVGPEKEVFETLETFSTEVQRRSGLVLRLTKSEVYTHNAHWVKISFLGDRTHRGYRCLWVEARS